MVDVLNKDASIDIFEEWNPDERYIISGEHRTASMPDSISPEVRPFFEAGLSNYLTAFDEMRFDPETLKNVTAKLGDLKKGTMLQNMLSLFGRDDFVVDPAVTFALDNVDFFPRPWEGKLSKLEGNKRMQEWNAAVDRYIETASDPRKRIDIEIEAKIGPHGGPLYRRCETEDCDKVEGRDIEKLQACAQCRLVYYCSKTCQKIGWKEHKAECKAKTHRPQQLDSQWVMEQVAVGMTALHGMSQ
ncbi:hypothetical protein VKT23_005318 [Stygiomarasmius scandens]|uniref:MYND-type domain-containing protein n=1 Tax=Marasmiellus scandens TaxID=2682957 RepID=A0ABR1JR88_9AGAR